MSDHRLDDLFRHLFDLDDELRRIDASDRRSSEINQWTFASGAWQRYSAIANQRLAVVNEIAKCWADSAAKRRLRIDLAES